MSDLFDRAQGEVNCLKCLSDALHEHSENEKDLRDELKEHLKGAVRAQLIGEMKKENEIAAPAKLRTFPEMTLGSSVEATKGLRPFIGLRDDKTLSKLLEQDIGAMQDEVKNHGSLQDLENFFYVCYGVAQHKDHMPAHVLDDIKSGKYHGGKLAAGEYDAGNKGKRLHDFVNQKESHESNISESNALAARLYTTSSYKRFNVPLRRHEMTVYDDDEGRRHFDVVPHPFKMTVYFLDEGLWAMRTIEAQNHPEEFSQDHRLYRGMKGMTIFNSDGRPVEALEVGGIERAPMSTTVQRHTAASYAGALSEKDNNRALETGPRTILEFVTEGLSTGTLIKFLSVYPTKEEEYLYPPLTRIKLDEHVIISQEKFESLFPENDLKSADLNTGFFDRAKKALAAQDDLEIVPEAEAGVTICKMSVQLC